MTRWKVCIAFEELEAGDVRGGASASMSVTYITEHDRNDLALAYAVQKVVRRFGKVKFHNLLVEEVLEEPPKVWKIERLASEASFGSSAPCVEWIRKKVREIREHLDSGESVVLVSRGVRLGRYVRDQDGPDGLRFVEEPLDLEAMGGPPDPTAPPGSTDWEILAMSRAAARLHGDRAEA